MATNLCIAVVLLCMVASFGNARDDKSGKTKLQIGIKKRADSCPMKSKNGDFLHMHYTGYLEDGTVFDSSYERNSPLTFTLGSGQVIKGWDRGLLGMCEGEKRKLVIPSELGYGAHGSPPKIPGGATLIFEVELIQINRKVEFKEWCLADFEIGKPIGKGEIRRVIDKREVNAHYCAYMKLLFKSQLMKGEIEH